MASLAPEVAVSVVAVSVAEDPASLGAADRVSEAVDRASSAAAASVLSAADPTPDPAPQLARH